MKRHFISLTLLTLITITSCGNVVWNDEIDSNEVVYIDPSEVEKDEYDFHTDLQEAYIKSTYNTINKFVKGSFEASSPIPITIDVSEEASYFHLSETESFTEYNEYQISENKVDLYNLKLGTKYYWKTNNGIIHNFTTCQNGPRNLFVEGVNNVRDLGGYSSKLGGKIRQGLFFRGAALTYGLDSPSRSVTEKGYQVLTKELKVKSEIDLRRTLASDNNSENGNMDNSFFEEIEYYSLPINWSKDNCMINYQKTIGEVFKIYAVEDNYPIYVHCSIGTDRTGLISYLMGALLGMNYSDLYHDYLFSNFSLIHSSRDISIVQDTYQNTLKAYNKSTLAECAEAYLIKAGLTKEEIENIRNIMIEK